MTLPPAQTILSTLALMILGILAFVLVAVPVPQANHDFLIYILGALSGALTGAGAAKMMERPKTPAPPAEPKP